MRAIMIRIFEVAAWILGVLIIIASAVGGFGWGTATGSGSSAGVLLGLLIGVVYAIFMVGFVILFVDIAHNTRRTAELLEQRSS